jgi:thiol:disulfide interchange protein DsbD
MFSSWLGSVLVCLFAGPVLESHAAQPAPRLVEVQLLADAAAIEPGGTFQLGVLFKMAPDWRVYWKNPGDAGLATSVRFRLPEDFKAGELHWPAPMNHVAKALDENTDVR